MGAPERSSGLRRVKVLDQEERGSGPGFDSAGQQSFFLSNNVSIAG